MKDYNDTFKKLTDDIVRSTGKALGEAEAARWTRFADNRPKKIVVDGKEAVLL